MNEQETKSLFLRNIHDPTYSTLKETLEINVLDTTLKELDLNIRKKERSMARKDDNVKRVRRLTSELGIFNEMPPTKKVRQTQGGDEQKTIPGTQALPAVLHPNMEGIIKIYPSSVWYGLSEDNKTFVLNYNRAVRHSEELPAVSKRVTIGEKESNKKQARRVRRAKASDYFDQHKDTEKEEIKDRKLPSKDVAADDPDEKEEIEDRKPPPTENVDDDLSLGSLGSIDEGNLSLNPNMAMKVTFYLHGGGNEVDDNEDEEEDEDATPKKEYLR